MTEYRLIDEPEFCWRLGGICHSTFWSMQQKPGFPQHVNLGRRKMWVLPEVERYIEKLVVFSRQQSKTTTNPSERLRHEVQ